MATAADCSKVVVLLLSVLCFILLPLFVGVLCLVHVLLFTSLCPLSFAMVLMWGKELVALL